MAPIGNRHTRPIFVWIPPGVSPSYKIEVIRNDGTIDDVTTRISALKVEDYATDSIGNFEMAIWDPTELYAHSWVGNEVFKYYKDYAATGTTVRFRGRIEKPSKRGSKLNVKGRAEGFRLFDVTVTKQFTNIETSIILASLFGTYATEFATTNIEVSTTLKTVDWYQKPFFECVKELCKSADFDFYIDANLIVNYFEKGSRINKKEGIVHDYNLLEIEDFTPDLSQIRNRIVVYGAEQKGIQVLYTAEQKTGEYGTSGDYGVREEIYKDDNITNYTQAKEIGDALLVEKLTPPEIGSIKGFILATQQPGDKIACSSPQDNIPPAEYQTTGYKDELNIESGKLTTTLYLTKEIRQISHVMKDRIEQENRTKGTNINPYQMGYSLDYLFDTDEGTNADTVISNGSLKLASGKSTGTWTSVTRSTGTDVTQVYLVMTGIGLDDTVVTISADGINDQIITKGEQVNVNDKGTSLNISVKINSATTEINSLSLQYKVE